MEAVIGNYSGFARVSQIVLVIISILLTGTAILLELPITEEVECYFYSVEQPHFEKASSPGLVSELLTNPIGSVEVGDKILHYKSYNTNAISTVTSSMRGQLLLKNSSNENKSHKKGDILFIIFPKTSDFIVHVKVPKSMELHDGTPISLSFKDKINKLTGTINEHSSYNRIGHRYYRIILDSQSLKNLRLNSDSYYFSSTSTIQTGSQSLLSKLFSIEIL